MTKRRRHEHAEANPLGDCGQPSQRRVRLGEISPGRTDLRNLTEMIHHPDVVDAGGLRIGGDGAQALGEVIAGAGPRRSSTGAGRP